MIKPSSAAYMAILSVAAIVLPKGAWAESVQGSGSVWRGRTAGLAVESAKRGDQSSAGAMISLSQKLDGLGVTSSEVPLTPKIMVDTGGPSGYLDLSLSGALDVGASKKGASGVGPMVGINSKGKGTFGLLPVVGRVSGYGRCGPMMGVGASGEINLHTKSVVKNELTVSPLAEVGMICAGYDYALKLAAVPKVNLTTNRDMLTPLAVGAEAKFIKQDAFMLKLQAETGKHENDSGKQNALGLSASGDLDIGNLRSVGAFVNLRQSKMLPASNLSQESRSAQKQREFAAGVSFGAYY